MKGACLRVLLALLVAGALAQPVPPLDPWPGAPWEEAAPWRPQRALQKLDGDPRAHLGALLARYVQQARKAPSGRTSALQSLQGLDPSRSHRISDRDYTGWMDFGRRSAEEYEYPS